MNTEVAYLKPASDQIVKTCGDIEQRFLDLLASWQRIKGEELIPPPDLDSALLLWRRLTVRLKSGDMRYVDDEVFAMRDVIRWATEMNCILRNQPMPKFGIS